VFINVIYQHSMCIVFFFFSLGLVLAMQRFNINMYQDMCHLIFRYLVMENSLIL
jgi:hypothetical protein